MFLSKFQQSACNNVTYTGVDAGREELVVTVFSGAPEPSPRSAPLFRAIQGCAKTN